MEMFHMVLVLIFISAALLTLYFVPVIKHIFRFLEPKVKKK